MHPGYAAGRAVRPGPGGSSPTGRTGRGIPSRSIAPPRTVGAAHARAMTTIVKAANAAEFLTLVPRLLGFHATRSLVLVPFSGTRTLGAMRVDLPDGSTGADVDCAASTLIGMVCKVSAADAVALVAYTDRRFGHDGIPHALLARALHERA